MAYISSEIAFTIASVLKKQIKELMSHKLQTKVLVVDY